MIQEEKQSGFVAGTLVHTKHCCESMFYWADFNCPQHKNLFDCPDALIEFDPQSKSYGLIIHDGGSATIEINFCPWCGAKLRSKKN